VALWPHGMMEMGMKTWYWSWGSCQCPGPGDGYCWNWLVPQVAIGDMGDWWCQWGAVEIKQTTQLHSG